MGYGHTLQSDAQDQMNWQEMGRDGPRSDCIQTDTDRGAIEADFTNDAWLSLR